MCYWATIADFRLKRGSFVKKGREVPAVLTNVPIGKATKVGGFESPQGQRTNPCGTVTKPAQNKHKS